MTKIDKDYKIVLMLIPETNYHNQKYFGKLIIMQNNFTARCKDIACN